MVFQEFFIFERILLSHFYYIINFININENEYLKIINEQIKNSCL